MRKIDKIIDLFMQMEEFLLRVFLRAFHCGRNLLRQFTHPKFNWTYPSFMQNIFRRCASLIS